MLSRYDEESDKFSPEQVHDQIEDFEEQVSGKLTNAPTGRFLIAAGIFGALVIPCGLPAAGRDRTSVPDQCGEESHQERTPSRIRGKDGHLLPPAESPRNRPTDSLYRTQVHRRSSSAGAH